MKYACIQEHAAVFAVSRRGRGFDVSRSGFYAWVSRPESARQPADRPLTENLKPVFAERRQTYGTRRLQDDLDPPGQRVSRARIGRPMRQAGLRGKTRRRWRATTHANHTLPVAPNRLERPFQVAAPDRVDVGDITDVATGEGWLYLAVFLDLFARPVVGWAMAAWMMADGVIDALHMARWRRSAGPHRPRQPVRLRPLPDAVERPGRPLRHESQRPRLGQRSGRELLPYPQNGADPSAPLRDPGAGQASDLRVHRRGL